MKYHISHTRSLELTIQRYLSRYGFIPLTITVRVGELTTSSHQMQIESRSVAMEYLNKIDDFISALGIKLLDQEKEI